MEKGLERGWAPTLASILLRFLSFSCRTPAAPTALALRTRLQLLPSMRARPTATPLCPLGAWNPVGCLSFDSFTCFFRHYKCGVGCGGSRFSSRRVADVVNGGATQHATQAVVCQWGFTALSSTFDSSSRLQPLCTSPHGGSKAPVKRPPSVTDDTLIGVYK
jgi:hypothetical protein